MRPLGRHERGQRARSHGAERRNDPWTVPGPGVGRVGQVWTLARQLVGVATLVAVCLVLAAPPAARADDQRAADVVLVPVVNGTVSGWLVDFATERNYMVNTYAEHLDALEHDPAYSLAVGEVPTMVAMQELAPERWEQLRRLVAAGRADLASAFYLNGTVNLSGGEALMRLGIEGIRWQEAAFGRRPAVGWLVDTEGIHLQMPQLARQLGVRLLLYTRNNPAGKLTHRWRSPDGSTVLATGTGKYTQLPTVFTLAEGARQDDVNAIAKEVMEQREHNVPGLPTLLLVSQGDYGRPPAYPQQAARLEAQWQRQFPDVRLAFGGPSTYLQQLEANAERTSLIDVEGDSAYTSRAFWVNVPSVKQAFRQAEHALAAAEGLATVASLVGETPYPSDDLGRAWIDLLLNMDRGVLWGVGAGEPFESPTSWDARDRFASIREIAGRTAGEALAALAGGESGGPDGDTATVTLFNSLNWERRDPVTIRGTGGRGLVGEPCERLPDEDAVLCLVSLPPFGVRTIPLGEIVEEGAPIDVPESVTTDLLSLTLDTRSGEIVGLSHARGGGNLLGGDGSAVTLEQEANGPVDADNLTPRDVRRIVASTSTGTGTGTAEIAARRGAVATTIETTRRLTERTSVRRTLRIYPEYPRLDLEVTLSDVPSGVIASAVFPLASAIAGGHRGVPYGASDRLMREGGHPAIRWSAVTLADGGGLALLDRGVPGREIESDTASVPLLNAHDLYRGKPNPWLSGRGEHRFGLALMPLAGDWRAEDVPRRAWELNAPPIVQQRVGAEIGARSWLQTSDNAIVESVRRVGNEIEIRLVEWPGTGGSAHVTVNLPGTAAFLTDALGEQRQPVDPRGPIELALRPQQIVTLRIVTPTAAPEAPPLMTYRSLVPPEKAGSLDVRHDLSGHPPE